MNRKLERRLILIGAIWEIITGVITITVYASFVKKQGLDVKESSLIKMEAVQSLFGSLYMFAVTFGVLFVVLGLIHLFLMKGLEDNKITVKIPIWFIIIGLLSYLLMDLIGAILLLSAGILALARNKSIKKEVYYNKGYV